MEKKYSIIYHLTIINEKKTKLKSKKMCNQSILQLIREICIIIYKIMY